FGSAPLTRPPAGAYNFDLEQAVPEHILYLEDVQKRIRGTIAGETVVDKRRGKRLHETGALIQWYVPRDDVRMDLLHVGDRQTNDPHKGETSHYTLRVGDRVEADAAWSHTKPPADMPQLSELIAFEFDRLDAWFEEDEQIVDHPRDPYHRCDYRRTSEHVEVRVGGETIAETQRAVKLFETSIPPRYYIPFDDVKPDCLIPSTTRGICPYKGRQAYYTVHAGDTTVSDGTWVIYEPFGEAIAVVGHLIIWGEGTEVYADGQSIPI
ncbi:MAG: DUF427 domain-containing protein, partial [Chloroflexota bacterium]|nr:DUF427 domain-containing protein [Chloroflexota bacterium]